MKPTIWERVWRRVRAEGECLIWTGVVNNKGYGWLLVQRTPRRTVQAHAVVGRECYGPASQYNHVCDTPRCVNPAHLYPGTQSDNVRDMWARGRRPRPKGERNPSARITEATALAILTATGKQVDIAARYGVSQSLVSAIKTGVAWGHLTERSAV